MTAAPGRERSENRNWSERYSAPSPVALCFQRCPNVFTEQFPIHYTVRIYLKDLRQVFVQKEGKCKQLVLKCSEEALAKS